jgi:hypothetical protein
MSSIRGSSFVVALCCLVLCCGARAQAQRPPEGKVEGAIWKFEISKVQGSESRSGTFRITGDQIMQKRQQEKGSKKVGTIKGQAGKPVKGDKVTVEFTALRSSDDKTIDLKGPIVFESFGEVTGRLIDAKGQHWNFKSSRIQE